MPENYCHQNESFSLVSLTMSQLTPEETKRKWRRLIGLGLAVTLLLGGFFGGRPLYREVKLWRAHRFAAQGEAQMAEQNWDLAYRSALAALQLSPLDARTLRFMARVLTRLGQEQALPFWNQLLLNPESTHTDRIEMIGLALRLKQWDTAKTQLNIALKQNPVPAETLQLTSEFLGLQGDIPQAIKYARAAAQSQPTDPATRSYLGRRLLLSPDNAEQQEGKTLLWQLAGGQDTNALQAVLVLVAQTSLTPEESAAAINTLETHPERSLTHEFLALDLKLRLNPEQRQNIIAVAIKKYPPLGDEGLLQLGRWLNRNKEYAKVLEVISQTQALASQDLFLVYLDALAGAGRWSDVEIALNLKNVPLEPFYVSLYRVRVAKELGYDQLVTLYWGQAQRKAAEKPQDLLYLARYAEGIGATEEALKAYRLMTNNSATARLGYMSLLRLTQQAGYTRDIREVIKGMSGQFPDDPAPRNDLAYLNLLLNENVDAAKAASLKLYQDNPGLLAHRTTLALAHLRANDPAAALALYQDVNLDWSATLPGWQAVHAAVLGAGGETNAARQAVHQIELKALKPEERMLIQPWL